MIQGEERTPQEMKNRQLLVIDWEDITTHTGWERLDDCKGDEPLKCRSVGWKISSDKRYVRISSMKASDGQCADRVTIPRGCITSIRKVE